jgi:RNA polymerase sigma-70 factor (ECF subfamily)
VEPARDGSRRADRERSFERLYRRHRADVYRALLRELGNREDAEDVTQTTFLDAYRALTRGGRPERPRAWLLTIAENARRRRYRALRRGPQESSLEREPTAADAEVTVRELRDALERLPPNQRATLVLREVAGLSYAEIASRLELTVAAVQMLLFRARRALRAELESDLPRGRAAGALAWPLPPWLAHAFGSPGSPAGLLPRAAGIVAAGAVGAAVVAGTGVLPGGRAEDHPSPRAPAKPAAADRHPLARLETAAPRRAAVRPEPVAARAHVVRTVAPQRPAPVRRAPSAPARPPAAARPAARQSAPPPAAAPAPLTAAPFPMPLVPDPLTPPPVALVPPAPPVPDPPAVQPVLPEPALPAPIAGELPVPAPPAGTGQDGGAAIPGLPPS